MLTLTPNAVDAVKVVAQSFGANGVRISRRPDGEAGQYDLNVVSAPEAEDVTIQRDGATVYLDPRSSDELQDLALDATITDDGAPKFGVVAPS